MKSEDKAIMWIMIALVAMTGLVAVAAALA